MWWDRLPRSRVTMRDLLHTAGLLCVIEEPSAGVGASHRNATVTLASERIDLRRCRRLDFRRAQFPNAVIAWVAMLASRVRRVSQMIDRAPGSLERLRTSWVCTGGLVGRAPQLLRSH